ncbi:hypothetical protein N7462_002450 [Penicillium macrosclerotiorum]|uniref:uncharacterized protein n=1 Tax=Penicillium macrosclerotiorum TaxID=303699 RepID=UPI002546C790|nr:uncharacterized protein N7462_002450 [Penicillium macrosclerotiorum]KAJ5693027.1 hypothetical protein N7462_002450 [Penicillium macrosclerotiorum]
MFALNVRRPGLLYSKVVEVDERVTLDDSTSYQRGSNDDKIISNGHSSSYVASSVVTGISGEKVRILQKLDVPTVVKALQQTYDEGFRSVAICLLYSYTFPDHEVAIAAAAQKIGFTQVSALCRISPAIRMLPRASSAVTDAYLTPEIREYLQAFESGVLRESLKTVNWRIMQSDGGLVHPSQLSGLHALLSGPAGGVVGYARTCFVPENPVPVIGFDMGGTSTDISRYSGSFEHVFETVTAGVPIQVPQLDINTVAAGGGSILSWRKGMLTVGPDSAGSHPGPACYRKGGPLTVIDANLILGRIIPKFFIGSNQDQPLDYDASYGKMKDLTNSINTDKGTNLSVEEVAQGYITIANEAMCRPIRAITEARGFRTGEHNLACFGGAGGQHACEIAKELGISRVLIHKYFAILSAYGMALADTVQEARVPYARQLTDESLLAVRPILENLRQDTINSIQSMEAICNKMISSYFLNLRYDGSDTSFMIEKPEKNWDFKDEFVAHHQQHEIAGGLAEFDTLSWQSDVKPVGHTPVSFPDLGVVDVPLYSLTRLHPGDTFKGPRIVIEKTQTVVVSPGAEVKVLSSMLVIDLAPSIHPETYDHVDPIRLSVFANRFMGIAEQMGRALQKTRVSTDIKERLDFSCAIFSADGGLVANAPHVPAMLGSMAFAVQWQIQHWKDNIHRGDVFLTNSPNAGGTHLPELTVITPIFDEKNDEILFWTASRGHHADIGGIVPGSMPATSRELWEEGAAIDALKVVEDGIFQEERVVEALLHRPALYPNCEGSRCIEDNITNIKAQAAANHYGVNLVNTLIAEYTLHTVMLYMDAVQKASENAIRETLKSICVAKARHFFEAEDFMDDGSIIKLKINIDPNSGSAIFDFDGTSPQAYGNWNAPPAVTNSATIYSLRCLVASEIPLNQGCMFPIQLKIPERSLLSPSPEAACAAGNGLTCQRIVDIIFKALEVCAASNGCMANFTSGLPTENGFGYYETIAGGSGAGPAWQGEDGVHCHMTNTRITDAEILERRYPVLLREYSLRRGSGGPGMYRGGDGVARELEFQIDMHAGILSERRVFQPYGMAGGENGARGLNLWIQKSGLTVNIGGKNQCNVKAGDRIRIMTPGGGGYGAKAINSPPEDDATNTSTFTPRANGSYHNRQIMAQSN